MAKNFPGSDAILSALKEKGIDVAAKMNSTSVEDGQVDETQQQPLTSQDEGRQEYREFSMDEDDGGARRDTNPEVPEVEVQGTPEGDGETVGGKKEETADLTLESGTKDMPFEKREKLLIQDYHKKTAALAEQRRQLEQDSLQVRAAAEKVQQVYDYVENVMRQQQFNTPQQRQQPDSEEAKKQRVDKIIHELGLEVDQYTDGNVLKLALALDEGRQYTEQLKSEMMGYIGKSNESTIIGKLKSDYAAMSEKYKLDSGDEEGVLAMMNNMLQYNKGTSMEDAVKKYLSVTRFDNTDAMIERLKRSGNWDAVKKRAFDDMRKRNDAMPTVPSGAGATGGNVASQAQKKGPVTFSSIREAASAAIRDMNSGRIRNTTRRK